MHFARRIAASAVLLALATGVARAGDLAWVRTWEKAQEQAAHDHKLVLHFSLIGELDKPDC
jgi:hypothetical protein